jgi:L-seryl-tRNA(Ser) seleniumtransferase
MNAQELEARLRRSSPPVIARIEHDRLLLDLRTVFPEQEDLVLDAFEQMTRIVNSE